MRVCSVKGCDKNHYGLSYCEKHYAQIRYYGKILPITVRTINEIIIKEDHAEIVLRNVKHENIGKTLIDLEDVEKCKEYKWYSHNGYIINKKIGYIARFILNVTDSKIHVDHINHNTLDNRKENLRVCSHSENGKNKKIRKGGTSKYKGVCWAKNDKKWIAYIGCNGKRYALGHFTNEKEAALAYNKKAKELHGEFACLNTVKLKLKLRRIK